jgi:hypothetical protein
MTIKPQISKFQAEKSCQVGFNMLQRLYTHERLLNVLQVCWGLTPNGELKKIANSPTAHGAVRSVRSGNSCYRVTIMSRLTLLYMLSCIRTNWPIDETVIGIRTGVHCLQLKGYDGSSIETKNLLDYIGGHN